ncbi:ABC transporter permease [Actinoplanes ianthinogenes]|uniref:ABC transporter permease n=1 Tax=Actinoplanes ianthinogenes TaxID=122358 RepID=A0ABM7LPI7_9ACTN|nr:ABC transporter ATP-binding protein [Actinoplanes ianthinogenes]BCJ41141.1 ABC transporter permease [Actinoplanes ianthinogenes]GGR22631.1 ABC transporter permease [Actinoplanes ianthinogenes]
MRQTLKGSWRLLTIAWRLNPRKTASAIFLMFGHVTMGPVMAAGLGVMTDAVVGGDGAKAAWCGVLVAILVMITLTFGNFAHIAYTELSEIAERDLVEELMLLSNGSEGIEHHERVDYADELTVLRRDVRRLTLAFEALFGTLGLVLFGLLTAILLGRVNLVLLLLMPVAALPPLLSGRWAERRIDDAKTSTAESTRIALNLFRLATSARFGGELRVFGLRDELRRRHRQEWGRTSRGLAGAYGRGGAIRATGQVLFGLAYTGAVLLVIRDVVAGQGTIGDVVLVMVLASQVNHQVITAITLLGTLQRVGSLLQRFRNVRKLVTVTHPEPVDQAPPARLTGGIVVDGVDFAYPGTDTPVLSGVSLTLPAGASVAIVGENGAGKSTLVKLLCGLYQPSGGRILVDGTDLRRIPAPAWREQVSAGFQDFARFELRTGDVVGLGDLPRIGDDGAVATALDRAQGADVVARLEQGLDTQLGKSYTNGAELSGGQWQKLAIGRALMRETPLLLVLDEPTSALDPQAEHRLFELYAEQARQVRAGRGAITLFVSHRFSTVRMADLIIVLRDGRVVETGDHDSLMGQGGLYADLFDLQAKAYR